MAHTLAGLLEHEAHLFVIDSAIARPGDLVETTWTAPENGGWKKPRKVRITSVGAHLVIVTHKGRRGAGVFEPRFDMVYVAQRLRADGTSRERSKTGGIVLRNLMTASGKKWTANGQDFNHIGVAWTVLDGKC